MKKLHNIEFVRFFLAMSIVYYHLLHWTLPKLAPDVQLYQDLSSRSVWCYLGTDMFLILGGFFLYRSTVSRKEQPFLLFVLDRFFRLWPVLAFYTAVHCLFFRLKVATALDYLFLLQGTGLSISHTGIIWFIAPFFWASLLVASVLRSFQRHVSGLLLAVFSFLGYAINVNHLHGGFGREVVFSFASLGMLRAIAGLSLGSLCALFVQTPPFSRKCSSRKCAAFATIVELSIGAVFLKWILIGRGEMRNTVPIVAMFSILLLLAILRIGLVSRLLDWRGFDFPGRYSYSVYVMSQTSFYLLTRTLWKNGTLLHDHPIITLALSMVVTFAVGAATYHLVEKPCAQAWIRCRNRLFSQAAADSHSPLTCNNTPTNHGQVC